jgi:branched-chain amino acid transport system permease protein
MITLALAQMLYFLLLEAPFTHGEDGLQGIERGNLLGLPLNNDTTLFYVVLGIFTIAFLLIQRIAQSPFGQLMMAIRDNENRATSLGHNTYVAKLLAFVISSGLAGLAGSLKAVALGFASLGDAHWSTSGLVILMVLLGGLGTAWGPLLGALLIITLDTHLGDIGNRAEQLTGIAWFGGLGESVGMVTGLVFLGSVLAFRRGIVGTLIHLWHKQARARSAQSVDPTTSTTTDHIA